MNGASFERCQHPAISVGVGDDRRAVTPRLVLGVGDAGAGLAGLRGSVIHIADVGIPLHRLPSRDHLGAPA